MQMLKFLATEQVHPHSVLRKYLDKSNLIMAVVSSQLNLTPLHCAFIKGSKVIRAKVPILKFWDKVSAVECDLNINNAVGIRNTHLLKYYTRLDPRVRPLGLYIKHWARFHDINDASKQTLSSYSLSLMLIHYLQYGCSPPVLPSLQKIEPRKFNNSTNVRDLQLDEPPPAFKSENKMTIGDLFVGFLGYYRSFDFGLYAISVRLGTKIPLDYVKRAQSTGQWKFINIEGSKLVKDTCPSTVPYGVSEMFKDVERKRETPKPAVPIDQRVCHQEAMLLGFVAENSLSFSIVPKIVDLTKELARDKSALERLSIDRTTASYKMRHGLAASVNCNLNNVLQNCHFSLNVDESTSNNYFKVLEILVSYFSEEQSAVVVQHLDAISLIKVNAESIHTAIVDQFEKREIPWNNLVSILMDSCNVMRGTKSGVETRIREQNAPHLLNVDGDLCHHVNNIAKKFCCALKTGIPKLFTDLHNDFKWSADMRDFLQELCLISRVKYTIPAEHVSHRWLSIYGIAVDTLRMIDVLTIFYHGFLSKEDRLDYTAIVVEIYRKHQLNDVVKERIREIHRELEKKLSSCTQDGKDRKHRIIEKLFYNRRQSLIVMNIIESIYPMFKRYVMLFQKKDPMIHLLHEEQVKLVKDLYSCFMKPEKFTSLADTDLLSDDVNIRASTLCAKDIFIGASAKVLIRDAPKIVRQITA